MHGLTFTVQLMQCEELVRCIMPFLCLAPPNMYDKEATVALAIRAASAHDLASGSASSHPQNSLARARSARSFVERSSKLGESRDDR